MTVVVDASVAFNWYVDEPGTEAAWTLMEAPDPMIAPELVVIEVCNAASRAYRRGEVSATQQARIAAAVVEVFDRLEPLGPFADRASAIAREIDHQVYDCFYLALSEARNACLVTADERLLAVTAGTAFGERSVALRAYRVEGRR